MCTKLLASTVILLGLATGVQAAPAIGVSGGTMLFSFDTEKPAAASAARKITGMEAGDTLVGIDVRPAKGTLYGLSAGGKLYTIDPANGAATLASSLSTMVTGTGVDIAFNPVVDRLRIVTSGGQNLRVDVDKGAATIDTPLAYAAGDVNAGKTPGVTAAAYTAQTMGTVAATMLYNLDTANGVLVTQAPPNNGTLNTVGKLGVPGLMSFDIDGASGAAYAASAGSFYKVDLKTGAATLVGKFKASNVTDFALLPTP